MAGEVFDGEDKVRLGPRRWLWIKETAAAARPTIVVFPLVVFLLVACGLLVESAGIAAT
jgi:hypothetical protein